MNLDRCGCCDVLSFIKFDDELIFVCFCILFSIYIRKKGFFCLVWKLGNLLVFFGGNLFLIFFVFMEYKSVNFCYNLIIGNGI